MTKTIFKCEVKETKCGFTFDIDADCSTVVLAEVARHILKNIAEDEPEPGRSALAVALCALDSAYPAVESTLVSDGGRA